MGSIIFPYLKTSSISPDILPSFCIFLKGWQCVELSFNHCGQVTVRPKISEWTGLKKLLCTYNSWTYFAGSGRKAAEENFLKFLFVPTVMTNSQRQRQHLIFISNWPFGGTLHWCFCEIGRTYQSWPNFFYVLAGKQFRDLSTLLSTSGKFLTLFTSYWFLVCSK